VEALDFVSIRKTAPVKKALDVIGGFHGSNINGFRSPAVRGISQFTRVPLEVGSPESHPNPRIRPKVGEPGRMRPGDRDEVDAIAFADGSDAVTAGLSSLPADCGQDTLTGERSVSKQGT
jgi:hypothetical protein